MSRLVSHKLVTHQALGGMDARVQEAMKEVKPLAPQHGWDEGRKSHLALE